VPSATPRCEFTSDIAPSFILLRLNKNGSADIYIYRYEEENEKKVTIEKKAWTRKM